MFTKSITAVNNEVVFIEKYDHGDEHLRIFRIILACF